MFSRNLLSKAICLISSFFLITSSFSQGVTIGSNNPPDPSAILDLQSSSKGFMLPRLTTTQRNAIANPLQGLQIFNTTTTCVEVYFTGIGWKAIACACTVAPPAPGAITGSANVCLNQQNVTYTIAPVVGASTYTWTVPNGATVASGQGTNSITVNFGTSSGNVSVTAGNSCGTSAATNFAVTVANPNPGFTYTPNTVAINASITFTPTATGVNYQWTFPGGNPATSTAQNPVVTWANTGTYTVKLKVTANNNCVDSSTQNITVINCVTGGSRTFTNCSATLQNGPSQNQCNSAYGPGIVTAVNGIQYWTVPAGICSITIDAYGSQGGGTGGGNLGARMQGTFTVTPGMVLGILVGQMGETNPSGQCGGGGGGTFVFSGNAPTNNNLLIAAAGGGGFGWSGSHNMNGQSTTSGVSSCNSTGGSNGNGGGGSFAGGGGGYLTNGASGQYGSGGQSLLNGGAGGGIINNANIVGGFGGGGAGHYNCEGGGGGGYSGGAGGGNGGDCRRGAGGGSINNGTNQTNQSAIRSGHGQVIVSW